MLFFFKPFWADYNSEEDLASGLQKVGKVAMSMNPHSFSDRIAMDSFKGTLNPSQFKHQLERSFGFHLTQKEAGALMAHFDDDDSGSIEGSEVSDRCLVCIFKSTRDNDKRSFYPLVVHQSLHEDQEHHEAKGGGKKKERERAIPEEKQVCASHSKALGTLGGGEEVNSRDNLSPYLHLGKEQVKPLFVTATHQNQHEITSAMIPLISRSFRSSLLFCIPQMRSLHSKVCVKHMHRV